MTRVALCFAVGRSTDPASVRKAVSRGRSGLVVQGVKLAAASNEFFVEMIAAQTLRASRTSNLLAKKPEIDLLLRLAGTTQISAAIAELGVRKGEPFLVIVAGDKELVAKVRGQTGWVRLPRRDLTKGELKRIERAALLNATRG